MGNPRKGERYYSVPFHDFVVMLFQFALFSCVPERLQEKSKACAAMDRMSWHYPLNGAQNPGQAPAPR